MSDSVQSVKTSTKTSDICNDVRAVRSVSNGDAFAYVLSASGSLSNTAAVVSGSGINTDFHASEVYEKGDEYFIKWRMRQRIRERGGGYYFDSMTVLAIQTLQMCKTNCNV